MNKIVKRISACVAAAVLSTACTRVPVGHVGILVDQYGTNRGVQTIPVVTGRVWYNPMTQDVYTFPTARQSMIWTKNDHEGSEHDQSISFNSVEGAKFNADVSITYEFIPSKAPLLFVTFNKEPDQIRDVDVFSYVRDAFQREGGKMEATKIYGSQKQELLDHVKNDAQGYFGPLGFHILTVGFADIRVEDTNVLASINSVLTRANQANEAIAKIRQDSAMAVQKMFQARGDSAESVIRAQGQAQANQTLRLSITPELIQNEIVKKWDGRLPQVQGSGILSPINLPRN